MVVRYSHTSSSIMVEKRHFQRFWQRVHNHCYTNEIVRTNNVLRNLPFSTIALFAAAFLLLMKTWMLFCKEEWIVAKVSDTSFLSKRANVIKSECTEKGKWFQRFYYLRSNSKLPIWRNERLNTSRCQFCIDSVFYHFLSLSCLIVKLFNGGVKII